MIKKKGFELVEKGLLTEKQFDLLHLQRNRLLREGVKRSIYELAIENAFIKSDELSKVEAFNSADLTELVSKELCSEFKVRPIEIKNHVLILESGFPLTQYEKDEISRRARHQNRRLKGVLVLPGDVEEILHWVQTSLSVENADATADVENLNKEPNNSVVLQSFIDSLYNQAVVLGASDIHLYKTPKLGNNLVRFRVDGTLSTYHILSEDAMNAVFARVKMMANLDISNEKTPQDGRGSFSYNGRKLDLRINTSPNSEKERLTIRILDSENLLSVKEMFYPYPEIHARVEALTKVSKGLGGMCIVSGPTGSGKTTTLYGLLKEMDRESLNIMTAEDPVEYDMPLVNQAQINPMAGLNWKELLESQLRSDPDVLMLGELRNSSTAEISVHSADTGHFVFATLHTDDAISTLNRLISMLPPDVMEIGRKQIANNLKAIINQRLAKRLCSCAGAPTNKELEEVRKIYGEDIDESKVLSSCGCELCNNTGYKGRVLAPEALFVDSKKLRGEEVQELLETGDLTPEKATECLGIHYFPLMLTSKSLLEQGLIDIDEAKRILGA